MPALDQIGLRVPTLYTETAESATPLFDGHATLMNSLAGSTVKVGDPGWTGSSDATQSPILWGDPPFNDQNQGLYFMTNSITLQPDATYGTVYKYEIGPGDTNPYFDQPTKPNGELTVSRPISMGQYDWYAEAFKIVSPYTMLSGGFNVVCQYGYPALFSPPLSISFDSNGLGIDRHVGIVPVGGGSVTYTLKPRFYTVASVLDKWVEMVIGVKWAVDTNGEIYVYSRIKANGETVFSLQYVDFDHPTNQRTDGEPVLTIMNDKQSLYFGTDAAPPTNTLLHRGFTRWDNQADAIASMG